MGWLKSLPRKYRIVIVCSMSAILIISALVIQFSMFSAFLRDVPPQSIEYAIDPIVKGIERELLVNATMQAAAMWAERNPGLSFTMTDKPDVLQLTTLVPWYVEIIVEAVDGGIVHGFAECPIWDTDTTECTVYLHPYLIRESTVDLPPEERANVLAHELGHVLGLSHYPDSRTNHLMGSSAPGQIFESDDTKEYVVPEPLKP